MADLPAGAITRANGGPVWNLAAYGFLAEEDAPDSVHPGLWRHARLNMVTGLFKVCERVYQVRGMDLANMTILEGDTGLIVIDPLTSTQVAAAALALSGGSPRATPRGQKGSPCPRPGQGRWGSESGGTQPLSF